MAKNNEPTKPQAMGLTPTEAPITAPAVTPEASPPASDRQTFLRGDGSGTVTQIDLDERVRLGKEYVICERHQVVMEATSGGNQFFSWFKCPVEGCLNTQKITKPTIREMLRRTQPQVPNCDARPAN